MLNDYGRDHARGAELESPYGRIVSSWKREGGQILWQFTIPANTTAELRLRAADGKAPADGRVVRFLRNENGRAVFECAAGGYTIRIPES